MSDRSRRDVIAKTVYIAARDVAEAVPIVGRIIQIASDTYGALAAERTEQFVENLDARVERLEELLKEPEKVELFYRGLRLSVDARTADKIEALASAVAHGLTGDATRLEIAYMAVEAIGSLDEAQINVLRSLGKPHTPNQVDGFTTAQILSGLTDLDPALLGPILALLEGKGLVESTEPATGRAFSTETRFYVTALGRAVFSLLPNSPLLTPGESAQADP